MSHRQRGRRSQLPVLVSGFATFLNTVGGVLRALGAPLDRLSEEHLLHAAQRKTGLSDFGDDGFRMPLRVLIRSYNEESGLKCIARLIVRRRTLGALVNRLLVTNELKRHPEILQVPIQRPIFIASLPRTGTTFLHKLLAQDPHGRPLLAWETLMPTRWPADVDQGLDPRIKHAQRLAKVLTFLAPALRTIHDLDSQGPEECGMLLHNTFIHAAQVSPVYRDWFLRQPAAVIEAAYREYRQQLQLLHWQRPHDGHWLLKSPLHLYAIGALLTVFQDSAIILIHRDPSRAVASMCSFLSVIHNVLSDDAITDGPERRGTPGPLVVGWVAEGLRRAEAARADAEPGRIYDMHYQELVADPLGAVQRLYAHFGYPYTREFETRATAWLNEHPQHKHGKHRYNLEQFGLDHQSIDDTFSWYTERYHVPAEPPTSSDAPEDRSSRD